METAHLTEQVNQLKQLLAKAVADLEVAEAEAADTEWPEEKAEALSKAISNVTFRLSGLLYRWRDRKPFITA